MAAYALFILSLVVIGIVKEWKHELVLASPFTGQLTSSNGKTVSSITVTRLITWPDDAIITHTTVTDENGNFSFPAAHVKASFWNNILPNIPSVDYEIEAEIDGAQKLIFSIIKSSYLADSEAGSFVLNADTNRVELQPKKLNLICNIDKDAGDDGRYWGVCKERFPNEE